MIDTLAAATDNARSLSTVLEAPGDETAVAAPPAPRPSVPFSTLWEIPAAAEGEWLLLQAALVGMGRQPACEVDAELWWSHRPAEVAEAVAACGWCPVRSACLAYALAAREAEGVWGGATGRERRTAWRRLGEAWRR